MRISPSQLALFLATSNKTVVPALSSSTPTSYSLTSFASFIVRETYQSTLATSTHSRTVTTAARTIPSSLSFLNLKRPICSSSSSSLLPSFLAPSLISTVTSSRQMSSSSSPPSSEASPTTCNTKIALLQFKVTSDKNTNHKTAKKFLQKAHDQGASLVVLPEIWNSPYATTAFEDYAELLPSIGYQYTNTHNDGEDEVSILDQCPSAKLLFQAAVDYKMYIIGGSIPEVVEHNDDSSSNDDNIPKKKIYNTCLCISPNGTLLGKHRKAHLFDIDVPGGITFRESDTLSSGNTLTNIYAGEKFGNIGVGICYDIRFPEYALLLTKQYSCNVLIYPGAFNMTTGPAHWELLQRARAVDNQCFVLTASPARVLEEEVVVGETTSKHAHYTAWGHSSVINPWGELVGTCGSDEDVVVADLNIEEVDNMRQGIPTSQQKRNDLYKLTQG